MSVPPLRTDLAWQRPKGKVSQDVARVSLLPATTYCWQLLVNGKLRTWAPLLVPLLAKTEPYRCWPWSGGCMLARAPVADSGHCMHCPSWLARLCLGHSRFQPPEVAPIRPRYKKSLAIGVGNIDGAAALTLSTHGGPDCELCKPTTFAHGIYLGLSGHHVHNGWPVCELCVRAAGNRHAASPFTQAMNDQAP
jgi:hypothetical protein